MNSTRRITISILSSITLLALVFGMYYWQQIASWTPILNLFLILIFGIIVIGKFLSTCIFIVNKRKELTPLIVTPSIIYLGSLILIFFHPTWLSPETFLSPIQYRGCYEGTINTGTIYFRESGDFEYRHVGFMGSTIFEKGVWRQKGDTLIVSYKNDVPEFVGDTLLMTEDRFYQIKHDSLLTRGLGFYRGVCKGLN